MKTNKKIKFGVLMLCAISITTPSCKKFLDTKTTDLTTEAYFNNPDEANTYLNGVYDAMNRANTVRTWYGANYQCYITQGTDESYLRNTFPESVAHYSASATDINIVGLWTQIYTGINRANTLIENIDRVQDWKPNQKNHVLGEAKFLRAFYHFTATQWWGDVPLRTSSIKTPEDTNIAFTKSKDVYDWVIKEMTEAEALLATQQATDVNPYNSGRVVQTTVQGILARVCLYAAGNPINDTKRFAEAKMWADKCIKSGLHQLNPSYEQVFINHSADIYDVANKESMWEAEFTVQSGNGNLREGANVVMQAPNDGTNPNGKTSGVVYATAGLYRAYQSFYNPITKTDNSPDYRRDVSVTNFSYTGGSATVPSNRTLFTWDNANNVGQYGWWLRWPGKWLRENEVVLPRDVNFTPENFPILRYADVLLMFAEAENELNGPTSQAIDAVNLLRKRAYGGLTSPVTNGIELTLLSPGIKDNGGTGYTVAPTAITTTDGSKTLEATIGSTISGGLITSLIMNTSGKYSVAPSMVYLGSPWVSTTVSGVNYALNAHVVVPGSPARLYRVTTAGTSTSAPTHTTGSSTAGGTAVFTYAGQPATATVKLLTGELNPADYSSKDVFRETIKAERMRELCFEALRRQDLKRWGDLVKKVKERTDLVLNGGTQTFFNGVKTIPPLLNSSGNIPLATPDGLNVSEKWNVIPIPLDELSNNKLAKQNPGF